MFYSLPASFNLPEGAATKWTDSKQLELIYFWNIWENTEFTSKGSRQQATRSDVQHITTAFLGSILPPGSPSFLLAFLRLLLVIAKEQMCFLSLSFCTLSISSLVLFVFSADEGSRCDLYSCGDVKSLPVGHKPNRMDRLDFFWLFS